jgi:hypothetical protein
MCESPKLPFTFWFSDWICITIYLIATMRATCPTSILLDMITVIIWVLIKTFITSVYSSSHCMSPSGKEPCFTPLYKSTCNYALVRKRTIPTAWPPLVGEVSANFLDRECRVVSATDPHGRIFGFLDPEPLFFHSSSSSVILTRLSGPRSRPTTSHKIW